MKNKIIATIAIVCAIVCICAHLRNEYQESVETIQNLENEISQVKNDWDIYNYKGKAVTGAWMKLHLRFDIRDAKHNLGYLIFN